MTEKPFTVAQVAERWACSPDAVYALIRSKKLQAFRVGGKLLRIQAKEIERWESIGANTQSESTGSDNYSTKPSSVGQTKRESLTAEDLVALPR